MHKSLLDLVSDDMLIWHIFTLQSYMLFIHLGNTSMFINEIQLRWKTVSNLTCRQFVFSLPGYKYVRLMPVKYNFPRTIDNLLY
jgi:hypothetical protein